METKIRTRYSRGQSRLSLNRWERPIYLADPPTTGAQRDTCVSAEDGSLGSGTVQTEMTLSISHPCYTATVGLADSPCGLLQFKPRPPLIAVGFRELGAEQEDLGRVIDPYQNNDERARSAVG